MPVHHKKLKYEKRRSHLIKPIQSSSIPTSKFHQVCFSPKSKSSQDVKSQSKYNGFTKHKKKYKYSIDEIKLIQPDSIDIESLTFSPTKLSSSTSRQFDFDLTNSGKCRRHVGDNLDYHITQLENFTFNPVSHDNLYSYLNMTEELKVDEENIKMNSENQEKEEISKKEELTDYADSDRSHLRFDHQNDDDDDNYTESGEGTFNDRSEINEDKNEKYALKLKDENDDYEEEEENFMVEEEHIVSEAEISSIESKTTYERVMESVIFNTTITKMSEADEKRAALEEEIKELQKEVKMLQNKEDATDSDHEILKQKQLDLVEKIKALDFATKKLQEDLGLDSSPSHDYTSEFIPPISRPNLKDQETVESKIDRWKAWEDDNKNELESSQQSYLEDKLPRVIVCGRTDHGIPRIVIAGSPKEVNDNIKNAKDISEITSNNIQDRQNKVNNGMTQLENDPVKIQEEKNYVVENLQQKICHLQSEMRMIMRENEKLSRQMTFLNQKIGYPNCPTDCSSNSPRFSPRSQTNPDYCNSICAHLKQQKLNNNFQRLSGGGSGENICCFSQLSPNFNQDKFMASRGPTLIPVSKIKSASQACPAEIEDKLMNYESDTKQLEQQLMTMETTVHQIKLQLENTQKERHQLQQQSKLLKCTAPCAPCPCPSSGNVQNPLAFDQSMTGTIPPCTGPCTNAPTGTNDCLLQQLRDLREQYTRLQEDYKNKLKEVSYHRTNIDKMKQDVREAMNAKEKAENQVVDLQERLKMFESDKNKYNGSKEQIMEQEHTLIVMKQRYRESQDELEELRALIQDQANQLEDYRNKYLQAQEQVEEQKRQLDLMEMDNARMNDNVTLEIGRVKNQFQEKLAELAPLPDLLKQTQIKLQECQQKRLVAERNCEELTRELLSCKEKIGAMTNQSEMLKNENVMLKGSNPDQLDDLENSNRELRNENERLKNAIARFEDREADNKRKLDEKAHEIVQLTSMLEQIREDSARQVSRTKERCETVRRSMQAQINELETQLVQCRAAAKSAQRDRDEIRQKMQGQLNHLYENFDLAQGRIRTLQAHVNYLKTSYSNIFNPVKPGEDQMNSSPPSLPLETNIL
ncbi:outer dense fiber protein 2 [Chelonus insularis]|uniref:outer dense fiber protein 2 n=1 Tax=Chelonus insularis TaxID=460826 RepID=UPI00158CC07F|nr:outer dense fiber protein 2 [Chelonus insularis]